MAQHFQIHPENPQPRLVKQAAQIISAGGIVAAPTDSAYALVCRLDDKAAVEKLRRIRGVVEKPDPSQAPSDLAIIGRYVLTPKIFEKLEQTQAGAGGEIQLTDAIHALMKEQSVFAYAFEGKRHDAGTTMGWLKASVELALEREEFSAEFRDYLSGVDLA